MYRYLGILVAAASIPSALAAAELASGTSVYECKFDVTYEGKRYWNATTKSYDPGQDRFSLKTRIETSAGKVQNVFHFNFYTRVIGEPGRSCSALVFRDPEKQRTLAFEEERLTWLDKGNKTTISYPKEDNIDRTLSVTHTKDGYLLDLRKLSRSYGCGAGVDFPMWVLVSKTSSRCKIRLHPSWRQE